MVRIASDAVIANAIAVYEQSLNPRCLKHSVAETVYIQPLDCLQFFGPIVTNS